MQQNYKKAFSLAEVLITLAIIGVVAAMSIPALINTFQNMDFVAGLKKNNAVLSQVTSQIISENGGDPRGAFKISI